MTDYNKRYEHTKMNFFTVFLIFLTINIGKISGCRKIKDYYFLQRNRLFFMLAERACDIGWIPWCCPCK